MVEIPKHSMTPMDRYCVFGNPIAHSKSPLIHAEFASLTQQQLSYDKQLVPEDQFPQAVAEFRRQGGQGANVTLPFKQQAFELCDGLTDRARLSGAVNTLYWQGDQLWGDNTDGEGLVRDLLRNGVELKGCRILLIGAGGAVRGVIPSLFEQQPQSIMVANRTQAKAETLAQHFSELGDISSCAMDEIDGAFDLIINGTSASLSSTALPVNADVIQRAKCCYDMAYGSEPTVFQQQAKQLGVSKSLDGLGMLIQQAAVSFERWRGVTPDPQPVYDLIKRQL